MFRMFDRNYLQEILVGVRGEVDAAEFDPWLDFGRHVHSQVHHVRYEDQPESYWACLCPFQDIVDETGWTEKLVDLIKHQQVGCTVWVRLVEIAIQSLLWFWISGLKQLLKQGGV